MQNQERSIYVHLSTICNRNDQNLLMQAVKDGKINIVEKLLKSTSFDLNHWCQNYHTAADYAWNYDKKQPKILLTLLKHNSRYPSNFCYEDIDSNMDTLKTFVDDCMSLHNIIECDGEESEIENILGKYNNLKYFYDVSNKSAVMKSKECINAKIYGYLISKNLYHCPLENDVDTETWSEQNKIKFRDMNVNASKAFSKSYLLILEGNSEVPHEESNADSRRNEVNKAFEYLDNIKQVQTILKVVGTYKMFRIIFDFRNSAANNVDPTLSWATRGVCYTKGIIIVAAKEFLNEDTKISAYSVLAHELCHFAMHVMYNNHCKPYFKKKNSNISKIEFENILERYKKKHETREYLDEIIDSVFSNDYEKDMYEAELIVRVPQLLVTYDQNEILLQELKGKYHDLFTVFDRSIEEMETRLPKLKKLGVKNVEKYFDGINKKEKRFKNFSMGLGLLLLILFLLGLAISIVFYFHPEPLQDLNNYFNCINCKFDKLTEIQKENILSRNVIFNGVSIKFINIMGKNESIKFLSTLNGERIQEFRDKDSIVIGNKNRFFRNNSFFIPVNFSNSTSENVTLQDLQKIFKSPNNQKTIVLLGEAGWGKSRILEKLESDMKVTGGFFKYTGMIKLGNVRDKIDKIDINKTLELEYVIETLINILSIEDKEEKFIFEYKFKNDEVILFWDAVDELILVKPKKRLLSLITTLSNLTSNEQWITSRYSHLSFESLTTNVFNLNLLESKDVKNFVEGYIKENYSDEKFENLTNIIEKKLNNLNPSEKIRNPLILTLIIKIYVLNRNSFVDLESFYKIFEELVKLTFIGLKEPFKNAVNKDLRTLDALMYECHEVFSLKNQFEGIYLDQINPIFINVQNKPDQVYENKYYNINGNMTIDFLEFIKAYETNSEICKNIHLLNLTSYDSRKKLNFFHPTIGDYFVVTFLHTSFFGITPGKRIETNDLNIKLRILMFIIIHEDFHFMKQMLIDSVADGKKIQPEVCEEFIKNFSKVFEMAYYNLDVIKSLSMFFKSNQTVIDVIWDKGAEHTAFHKFIKFNYYKNDFKYLFAKFLKLIKTTFGSTSSKVIEGKNQRLYTLSLLHFLKDFELFNIISQIMPHIKNLTSHTMNLKNNTFFEFYTSINAHYDFNFEEKREFFKEGFPLIFSMYIFTEIESDLVVREMNLYLNNDEIRKLFLNRPLFNSNFLHDFLYQNNPEYVQFMLEKLIFYVKNDTDIKNLILEQETLNGHTPLINVAYKSLYSKVDDIYYKFILKFLNKTDLEQHLKTLTHYGLNAFHLSTWNQKVETIFDTFKDIFISVFGKDIEKVVLSSNKTKDLFIKKLLTKSKCKVCKKTVTFLKDISDKSLNFDGYCDQNTYCKNIESRKKRKIVKIL